MCYVDPRSTFRIKRKGPDRTAHRAGKPIEVESAISTQSSQDMRLKLVRQTDHQEFNQVRRELVSFLDNGGAPTVQAPVEQGHISPKRRRAELRRMAVDGVWRPILTARRLVGFRRAGIGRFTLDAESVIGWNGSRTEVTGHMTNSGSIHRANAV
jgi:hypothetical protein